jgi:AcrR family transcriptional regulator
MATSSGKAFVPQDPSAPAPDRRQRRSAETRERLFRAALSLFGRKGFAETTVEDITNEADVGKGTFFNYFPSKEHLLIAFGDMQLERLQAAVDGMRRGNEPMGVFLENLCVRMMVDPSRTPDVVRALLQANLSSASVRSVMQAKHARAEGLLTELVQIGQDRGEFRRDLSAREIAQVFRQTTFGTLLLWSVFGDASLPERIRTAVNVLMLGLAPRGPADAAPVTSARVRS